MYHAIPLKFDYHIEVLNWQAQETIGSDYVRFSFHLRLEDDQNQNWLPSMGLTSVWIVFADNMPKMQLYQKSLKLSEVLHFW